MSKSRVTWATSVPILVVLGLSVLDLGPMYATSQLRNAVVTSGIIFWLPVSRHSSSMPYLSKIPLLSLGVAHQRELSEWASDTCNGFTFAPLVVYDLPDENSVVVGGLGTLHSQVEFRQPHVMYADCSVVCD